MRSTPHAYNSDRRATPRRLVPRRPVDFTQDPRFAYLEWLRMEARLLQIELGYGPNGESTPLNTFTHSYHFPHDISWRDAPQPSTRAELVLRAVGVDVPAGTLVPEGVR